MKLDAAILKGSVERPAVIFIHGLGMGKEIWVDPAGARILGGWMPLRVLLKNDPDSGGNGELRTLYHDLAALGYTVIAWSQSRPVGPAEAALEELREMAGVAGEMGHKGIILIGHSRGGLVARKYILDLNANQKSQIKALITLSAPHHGTGMARWAVYLSPFAAMLRPLLPEGRKRTLANGMRRIANFLESEAVRELLPDSDFLKSLSESPTEGLYALSAGGTNPALINASGLFSIPGSIQRLLPQSLLPEEMINGRGDGLVSQRSSVLPFADEHLSFHVNHAEIVVDKKARQEIIKRIRGLQP
ncbi:MAG: alpha/beta fold hydrolase [Thermodesulfovibrionales bacterium]|nr:alpha/beta fold hydrolase [Thermodesulfovibrionales bacterium]